MAQRKRVVVAFRGTDINWKDVLTDLMCFQTDVSWLFEGGAKRNLGEQTPQNTSAPLPGAAAEEATLQAQMNADMQPRQVPLAHIGFCIAYASCRDRLWKVMNKILPDDAEERAGWTICSTGHSLGGALSVLFAAECAVRLPETEQVVYNFGAPKVGCDEFVRRFNALVPNTFRVVNDADVIVRLPRNKGVGAVPGAGNYYHVGRTVLTSPECPVWVEGESEGKDPLSERWDSLSDLLAAEVRLMQTLVDGRGFVQHVEDGYYEAMLEILRVSEERKSMRGVGGGTGVVAPIPSAGARGRQGVQKLGLRNGVGEGGLLSRSGEVVALKVKPSGTVRNKKHSQQTRSFLRKSRGRDFDRGAEMAGGLKAVPPRPAGMAGAVYANESDGGLNLAFNFEKIISDLNLKRMGNYSELLNRK